MFGNITMNSNTRNMVTAIGKAPLVLGISYSCLTPLVVAQKTYAH